MYIFTNGEHESKEATGITTAGRRKQNEILRLQKSRRQCRLPEPGSSNSGVWSARLMWHTGHCAELQGQLACFITRGCSQLPPDLKRVTDTLIGLALNPNVGANSDCQPRL